MEKDERLLPLPNEKKLQSINNEFPASYLPAYEGDFEENRSIREYFNVVYKRLPIILALTVLVTTIVAFYMYRQPSVFQAMATMIIEPRKPSPTSKDSININFGNDLNYYNTQLRLLENPDLMREVVMQSGFYRQPELLGNQNLGFISTFRSIFSGEQDETAKTDTLPILTNADAESVDTTQLVLTPEEKALRDRYTGILTGGLSVEQEERTNIVFVKVRSTNPTVAAQTANKVVEVFIAQDIQRETQGAKQSYEELSKSIEDLKATVSGQELQLLNLLGSSNLPIFGDKGNEFRATTLQTAYSQYQEAANERLKIEARYKTALQANARGEGTSIPDLTDQRIYQETIRQNNERRGKLQDRIREIEKQINDAENELSQLRVRYKDEYIVVQQKIKAIEELKNIKEQTEKEVTQTIEKDQRKINTDAISGALVGLRSQLEAAQGREAKLYSLYKTEEDKANIDGRAELRLTTLKNEIATNRNLLDTYTQRQKEQELTITSSRPDNVKLSTKAQVSDMPIGPQRNRNIFIAFLISLVGGIGLAFLLDYLDDSVRSSDDVSRHLGLPTLAMIPFQSGFERGGKRRMLSGISANGNGKTNSTALITLEDNKSAIAEAYRHLRTSLLFSNAGHPPKSILVTSSQPAEGKTTTAINTAITLAQAGADVVIIDCDLRRPRLHSHFEMDNTHGLTNYLSGDRNTENLMKTFSGLPKLKVITSGPIPPNPTELLSSNEMKNLLQFLKGNYKHIIIDSPPAISFTDAAILSTLVDGVVLVAMVDKSSIHLMRRFKQRLATIGARIYGVVLNGMKANSAEYGYYGYENAYKYYNTRDNDDSTPLMEDLEMEDEWEEEILK